MANTTAGLTASWSDIWLLDGVRTPFADYNGALAGVSPTDLGIKAAREVFAHAGVAPQDVGAVITGSMAQASFDTYCLPRHIGLYPMCRSRSRRTWCNGSAAPALKC